MSLSDISFARYCQKNLAKSGWFGEKLKRGDKNIGEVVYRRGGLKPSVHYVLKFKKNPSNILLIDFSLFLIINCGENKDV